MSSPVPTVRPDYFAALRDAVPELDPDSAAPLFAGSLPVLRQVFFSERRLVDWQRAANAVELAVGPGAGYRLLESAGLGLARGDTFELDGVEYVVVRTGPSPLPVDSRRCAYLIRGAGGASSSDSS